MNVFRAPQTRAALRAFLGSTLLLCASLAGVVTKNAAAATDPAVVIQGPEGRVQLVELFTSEGCSSCPPADKWLARMEQDPGLWQRFAPIGLHVDYWDELGWRDRFANSANTARQRDYARLGRAGGVYTPGWFVDGREWRGWFTRQALPNNAPRSVGSLRIVANGSDVQVSTRAPTLAGRAARVHLVLIGVGLTSHIRRGENSGRTLNHGFVALAQAQAVFSKGVAQLRLPAATRADAARRYALVAWVTAANDATPLQVVGGWLPAASAALLAER